jgi:hypothetical protein
MYTNELDSQIGANISTTSNGKENYFSASFSLSSFKCEFLFSFIYSKKKCDEEEKC